MRNWDDLKFCHALFRHGTMSDAAKVLDTNVATVSRRLHRLSEEIGETLFVKEGNRWAPTGAGAELAEIAEQFHSRITESRVPQKDQDLQVQIRISTAPQVLHCGLVAGLAAFFDLNRSASVKFDMTKRSLALNECDVRIGFEEPTEGRIVRRMVKSLEIVPACHRSFRQRVKGWVNVTYADADDPQSHQLFDHFGAPPRIEVEGVKVAAEIVKTIPLVAPLPKFMVENDPELAMVSITGPLAAHPLWLSYHEARRRDPAVRLAVDFLESALNA